MGAIEGPDPGRSTGRVWPLLVAMCLIAAACGDDRGSNPTATTTMATTTTATSRPPTTVASTTTTAPPAAPPTATTNPANGPCAIEPPATGYDTGFYAKQCTVLGIPVLSSAAVADAAHHEAEAVIVGMMSQRLDLVDEMVDNGLRVGIIGLDEVTTDLPEYADLDTLFPETDWDTRTRGVGATLFIPMSSVGEENLLCLDTDVYVGESIMVHEFAHSVRLLGIATADRELDRAIEAAFEAAVDAGRWGDTYAATNSDEYWAEAVQSYFDTNRSATPANGIHNDVDTNEELAVYDPKIYGLIDEVFGGSSWRYACS